MQELIQKYLSEIESGLGILISSMVLVLFFLIVFCCQMIMKLGELNKNINLLIRQQTDKTEENKKVLKTAEIDRQRNAENDNRTNGMDNHS